MKMTWPNSNPLARVVRGITKGSRQYTNKDNEAARRRRQMAAGVLNIDSRGTVLTAKEQGEAT